MNAPVTLPAGPAYARPLFHRGQILPDTQLTMLGTFAAANLGAAARRHGWGIVQGFVPRIEAKDGNVTVKIGPGVAVDQKGRMLVIEDVRDTNLEALITASGISPRTRREATEEFDLWLIIKMEPDGRGEIARRDFGVDAPARKSEVPHAARPPREQPAAQLELRPASKLNGLLAARRTAYNAFAGEFDLAGREWEIEDTIQGRTTKKIGIQQIQDKRLALLAKAMRDLLEKPQEYDGIPLGRIRIDPDGRHKGEFDVTLARTEARDDLPAPRHRVNVAPVLGMEADAARAWLAVRGFQPWTVQAIQDKPSWLDWIFKSERFGWDLALRPGDTVRLFTHEGRIAVVNQGPSAADAHAELAVVFLALGLPLMVLAAWLGAAGAAYQPPRADISTMHPFDRSPEELKRQE